MSTRKNFSLCFLFIATLFSSPGFSETIHKPDALMELELEELGDIIVTTASKKEEPLFETAAAVYVITQEEIRRSGAASIPELLRLVPGMEVAHVDGNKWAITARGSNERFAKKLLVLMDGRSLYTPLFSGVYWDVQDTLMEDIDRIEVIRGPGGTLWGANAVNGVINIITKKARDTQGGIAVGGAGTDETGFGGLRYGGKIGDNAHYRAYAKYFHRDEFPESTGNPGADEWRAGRGGFRIDWDFSENNSLTVQADGYRGESGQRVVDQLVSIAPPTFISKDDDGEVSGVNLLTRWTHTFSDQSDLALQFYYDRASRRESALGQTIDTIDFDFQHRFALGERHEIVWGFGHRLVSDSLDNSFVISLLPSSRVDHTASAFVQDEITIVKNLFKLTLGSKFEWNSYTGFEAQPSLRALWTPNHNHTVWSAVFRAVRTPNRFEDSVRLNPAAFTGRGTSLISIFGNRALVSEKLISFEAGYRVRPIEDLLLDFAGFYNKYNDLRTSEPETPFLEDLPPPLHLVIPSRFGNTMFGETFGIEASAKWRILDFWRVTMGFNWFRMNLYLEPSAADTTSLAIQNSSPEFQVKFLSYLDLPYNLEFDTAIYFVDEIIQGDVPSYVRFDLRLGWHPIENLELSLSLQNLQDARHPEFFEMGLGLSTTEVPRSAYGKIIWRF